MTKIKTMITEDARKVAARLGVSRERGESYARMCAFDIASNFSEYTEEDVYEAIMWKARGLAKLAR